jgi:uncharacterized membrane protein YcaP (DUF421 family)
VETSADITAFDWHRIFESSNTPLNFLWEIAFRTLVMFLVLIVALKFLSKRGVKQLSIFELAILIALGSATGDPMFYHHIPLTYGILVLVVVIFLYRVITKITGISKTMEIVLEGKPVCLLINGVIEYKNYKKVGLPYDKFFSELRLKGIDHLGQVKKAYLETSGEISVYPFDDKDVCPGLPIYPEVLEDPLEKIRTAGIYACIYCGKAQELTTSAQKCLVCDNAKWLSPLKTPRVK